MNKFAERFREALTSRGLKQTELAKKLGMSVSAVNDYCRGKREPSFNVLVKICRILSESADYLLGIED